MFNVTPVLAISEIFNLLLANTIVLGGVPTGIIKAIEADNVAAIISNNGLTPIATPAEASIGSIICVVAVLEVNSVRKLITKQTIRINRKIGMCDNPFSCNPIISDKPLLLNARARANPPPNSKIIPHGICSKTFPVRIDFCFSLFDGIRKRRNAIVIATVPSSIKSGTEKIEDHPMILIIPKFKSVLNIQSKDVNPKIIDMILSSKENFPSDKYSF
jgi:hypothetical protein